MASVNLLTVLLLNVFSTFVSSLYFHIGPTERKCFIEEIPDQTRIVGDYWTQLYDEQRDEYLQASPDLSLDVVVKGPDDQLVLSQSYGSKGTFKFTSQRPGEYQICLQPDSSQRPLSAGGGMLVVHLDVRVTTSFAEYDKLTELQRKVRQLTGQVQQIQKWLEYQRLREKDFRQVSHSTMMWIFWWPVVRSLYVVFIVIWHTKSW